MSDAAMKVAKDAEKSKTIFENAEHVQKELIDPMNAQFDADVFQLNVKTDKKYAKVICKVPKCPFSMWLHFKIAPD